VAEVRQRSFPLQIHIATLFIGLGLMIGVATTVLGYLQVKELSVDAAFRIFHDFALSAANAIAQSRSSIDTSLHYIANDQLARATTLDERLQYIGTLEQVLHQTPQVAAAYIGYPNGDIIELRRLPRNNGYLVQSVERGKSAQPLAQFIYLNQALHVIGRARITTYTLDPRTRPWFLQAGPSLGSTAAYRFYSTGQLGVTLTLKASSGSVAAADVDLSFLSRLLRSEKPTASSRAAIIDQDGTVIAYSSPAALLRINHGLTQSRLATIDAFGVPQLAEAFRLAGDRQTAQGTLRDASGRTWLWGSLYSTHTASGQLRRIFTVVPEDDVLGAARAVRNRMLLLSAVILLVWLPIAWWLSSLVARPLKRLEREAATIRNLDFSEQPHKPSTVVEIEQLSETFDTMRTRVRDYNEAAARFVPFEFLEHLSRKDIIEVRLGDHHLEEMAVLFSDIRSFTSLSERMSPQETFEFLNTFLGEVGPIVREHGGFIDKYIGDAIMALFPTSNAQVIDAAIAMQKRADPLAIGIGVNRGPLMLGTIGERERFETTVIADAVNVAARIESLTKTLGVKILVSGQIAGNLNGSEYHMRELLFAQVMGTTRPTALYEIFDADLPELIEHKESTAAAFARARAAYVAGEFARASELFAKLAVLDARDEPVQWLRARSAEFAASPPADWTGVERLDFK
jgi:class 3 adenylate cyclase